MALNLYLMRHGEALSKVDARVGTDAERPLSPAGMEMVKQVANHFKAHEVVPTRLFTSSLFRARQTAELVATILGCSHLIEPCQALQLDQVPSAFLTLLRHQSVKDEVVAIGHQPLLGQLALQLACGTPGEGLALKPAEVCWLQLPDYPGSLRAVIRGLWNSETIGRLTPQ